MLVVYLVAADPHHGVAQQHSPRTLPTYVVWCGGYVCGCVCTCVCVHSKQDGLCSEHSQMLWFLGHPQSDTQSHLQLTNTGWCTSSSIFNTRTLVSPCCCCREESSCTAVGGGWPRGEGSSTIWVGGVVVLGTSWTCAPARRAWRVCCVCLCMCVVACMRMYCYLQTLPAPQHRQPSTHHTTPQVHTCNAIRFAITACVAGQSPYASPGGVSINRTH